MAQPVKFGWMVDFRNPPQWRQPPARLYADTIDFIAWTESLGFEGVWLCEHHGIEGDDYPPSPLMINAAIASRTKTMRLGTGVALAPFYHPVRLAEDMAVLDVLSDGRAEISLGLGYLPHEAAAYGFDFKSRGRRTNEMLQIIKRLWAGEEVTWKSEFFDLEKARIFPLPVQKPGIPVYTGALAEVGYRRTAMYADGYCGPIENYPAYVEALVAAGKTEADARVNMVSAYDMWTYVSEDPEAALEEIAPHAHYFWEVYAEWQKGHAWGLQSMSYEDFKKSGFVKVFTPEDAIEHFKIRLAIAPMDSFVFTVPTGMPVSKFRKYAELLATKVLPALR